MYDPCVLARGDMWRSRRATGEQIVLRLQIRRFDPCGDSGSGRFGQLELHRSLCLSLHNHRTEQDLIGVRHVPTSQTHQITAAQLAVDRQVEHGHVADVMCIWRWNRMGQISFALSGGFWPTSLPLLQDSQVWSVSMSGSLVVDGSLIVSPSRRRPLSGARLDACSRAMSRNSTS